MIDQALNLSDSCQSIFAWSHSCPKIIIMLFSMSTLTSRKKFRDVLIQATWNLKHSSSNSLIQDSRRCKKNYTRQLAQQWCKTQVLGKIYKNNIKLRHSSNKLLNFSAEKPRLIPKLRLKDFHVGKLHQIWLNTPLHSKDKDKFTH